MIPAKSFTAPVGFGNFSVAGTPVPGKRQIERATRRKGHFLDGRVIFSSRVSENIADKLNPPSPKVKEFSKFSGLFAMRKHPDYLQFFGVIFASLG
jgi:hypothetical protein